MNNNIRFNKTDYQLLGVYFIVYWVWNSFDTFFQNNISLYQECFINIPIKIIQMIILIWFVKWVIEQFLIKSKNYIGLFVVGIFGLFIIGFCFFLLNRHYIPNGYVEWERFPSIVHTIFFNVEDSIINVSIPLVLSFSKKYFEYREDHFNRINQQKELELKILRAQFDPHFLYNSLNTIDALVDYSSKQTIKKYISNLAALYRYLIDAKNEEIVSLEEELALIKNYFYVIETRFEGDYNFEIVSHTPSNKKYIPNGALLSAIENVVKHNTADEGIIITTKIHIRQDNVTIINNRPSVLSHRETLGTGLKNLAKRYKLLANKTIVIKESEEAFVLELPLLHVID